MLKQCKHHNNCVFRDIGGYCHALNSTTFINHSCPFAKTRKELISELFRCAQELGISWVDYKFAMKEVFDVCIYRALFGGDNK